MRATIVFGALLAVATAAAAEPKVSRDGPVSPAAAPVATNDKPADAGNAPNSSRGSTARKALKAIKGDDRGDDRGARQPAAGSERR